MQTGYATILAENIVALSSTIQKQIPANYGDVDYKSTIEYARQLTVKCELLKRHLVDEMRAEGYTWAEVGHVLGVTRGTAWEVYS